MGQISTALGAGSIANKDYSIAVGGFALADGEGAIATGARAGASGEGAVALGYGAYAAGDGSLALGSSSVAGSVDTVSFGHAASDLDFTGTAYGRDLNRRLIHVADGIDATDEVNKGQLEPAIAGVPAGGSGTPNAVRYHKSAERRV